jgi:hypothetical protein
MNTKFVIPPGEPNLEVNAQITLQEDANLVDMMPHMHLRGTVFAYRLVYPTGESETILNVPRFDFNWQPFFLSGHAEVAPERNPHRVHGALRQFRESSRQPRSHFGSALGRPELGRVLKASQKAKVKSVCRVLLVCAFPESAATCSETLLPFDF